MRQHTDVSPTAPPIEQAATGGVVCGRQVLFMFEQHFRTNEEAGALHSTEDLIKVVLDGNDLVSFLHSWDSVVAGMKIVPEQQQTSFCDRFVDARRPRMTWTHTNVQKKGHTAQAVRDLLTCERLISRQP